MKYIISLLVLLFCSNVIQAQHDKTYEYFLQSYIQTCQEPNEFKKINNLKILLIESNKYMQNMQKLSKNESDLVFSGTLALIILTVPFSDYKTIFYNCLASYFVSSFLLKAYCWQQNSKTLKIRAQLESLIAGIEARLNRQL